MLQKLLILLLALILAAPAPLRAANVVDDQIQVKEHDLEGLRRELAQKRAEKDKLDGREKSVLSEINGLEQRIDLAEKLVRQLKNKKAGCQKEVKSLTGKLSAAEKRAAARRQVLAERARQLYMHGRLGELEAFLSAASLPELARKVHSYRHLADQDQQLIQQALADQRTIAADKVELENQIEQTARLEAEKQREEKNLKGEKSGRSKLLGEIRDQKAAYEQAIRDLEESARQIQMIIEHLERQRDETPPVVPEPAEFRIKAELFEKSKGQLPWPVQGRVIKEFGQQKHPKYKTVTFNKGIDIKAPQGAEIRAVAAGKVLYVGWLRGYGQFLILSHTKGYYTLYAHASELLAEEGDLVYGGETIARVGDTGSLDGPKLHFEIRHSKVELNPREWLK